MRRFLKYKYWAIAILFVPLFINAQIKDSIKTKNKELLNIRGDIEQLEKELKSKTQKEKESLQALENITKQNMLLSKLINNIRVEENQKEIAVEKTALEIENIEMRINALKEQYSRYIVWYYKNRGLSFWRFVFEASSFNRAIKRYGYLKYILNQSKKTLASLEQSKAQLANLKGKYETERDLKKMLALEKLKEQEALENKERERKSLISLLKKDKKIISLDIATKRKAEIFIKNIISKLIESDREARKKTLEKKITAKQYSQSFDYNSLASFANLKGELSWPIKSGRIVRKFGENKNERLNTITLNYGIDIESNGTGNVSSVADGIVSAIDWIPGYGSIVIVTHKDEFRTVYGHVTGINVKEGQQVKAGGIIGQVSESLEGNILHFEIWNERNYQNPEAWLSGR